MRMMEMMRELLLNPFMRGWMIGLPVAYVVLALLFRALNLFPHRLPAGTRGSDYLAFDIVAGCSLTFLSVVGFISWFSLLGEDSEYSSSVVFGDKFYGSADFITHHIVIPMLSYQIWNTVICVILNDLRSPVMIMHHIVTATLAFGCLFPYGSYYTIYFFGVSEATNIPLTVLDIMEKMLLDKAYPFLFQCSQAVFFVSFMIIRVFLWTFTIYFYITESWQLVVDGVAHSNFHVITNLFSSFFLTGLQYYWAWSMMMMVKEMIFGKSAGKKKQ